MDRSESQAKFVTSAVKLELVDHSIRHESYKRKRLDDSCSIDWSHTFSRRPPHMSCREGDSYHRNEERSITGTRIGQSMPEIRVNQTGEPCGQSKTMVSDQVKLIVRKYVPVTTMWASVSKEVRYKIVQEVQSTFKDGAKLDPTWIKMKAGKFLASDRGKAKTVLWRYHSSLFETCTET